MNPNDGSLDDEWRSDENVLPSNAATELDELEAKLAELHARGILSGGAGARDTLRPVAHVPGALERFLKARG